MDTPYFSLSSHNTKTSRPTLNMRGHTAVIYRRNIIPERASFSVFYCRVGVNVSRVKSKA